jgi:uncharacterized membrane protein YbhN (UPF0104 family)
MRKSLIYLLRYSILAGILVFGGWYISTHFEQFAGKAHFTPGAVALLVFLNLCTILLESTRLRLMIRKLGRDLGQVTSWNMMTLMQAVNHVVLKAGTFSGGYYLSRRYGISLNSYIAFVMTYVVVMVLASGVLGLMVAAFIRLSGLTVHPYIPLFFILIIVSTAGCLAAARIRLVFSWLPKVLVRFFEALRFIYTDYRMLLFLLGIEILYYTMTAFRFMTAVSLFSGHSDFLSAVVVVTVGNFLRIATIVPGGIGIAELASGWTAGLLGSSTAISGLSAGLDRLVYVALIMIFGGVGFLAISNRGEFHRPAEENLQSLDR